jgi:hypothetical protein
VNQNTARKAAKWWADHVRKGAVLDNGDTSDARLTAMMLGYMLQDSVHNLPDVIQRFEDELASKLLTVVDDDKFFSIYCDYDPDQILTEVANMSGLVITITTFPWKTGMYFQGGNVTVSIGYGSEQVEIA